jgi:hypothetical protein
METGGLIKATFTPAPDNREQDASTIAIQINGFMFCEIGKNEFAVLVPSPNYGGVRAMGDDLNENAVGGMYTVTRMTPEDDEAFRRAGGHVHN